MFIVNSFPSSSRVVECLRETKVNWFLNIEEITAIFVYASYTFSIGSWNSKDSDI